MSSFVTPILAFYAFVAAWLSQATPAVADGGARVGLLPVTGLALALSLVVSVAVLWLMRAGASRAPLLLTTLVLLPWLPVPVPPAFMLWSGPLVLFVWAATLAGMLATVPGTSVQIAVRRPAVTAGLLALLVYALAERGVAPSIPGGDEPHYLVITQSLLLDHDLKIENNHARGDYRAFFDGDLSKPDYLRRGRDGQIYSIHAPGVAALVAPVFAIGGYPAVVIFLLCLSAVGAGLAWELARRVTGRTDAAWFGWAAIVFSPTVALNAFTVYPDGPAALVVLTGVWALIRAREERTSEADSAWPWFLHGAALAALPWLHTRFALIAGCIGALVMLELARTRNPAGKASAFLAVPTVSAVAWIGFFIAIYGAPDPSIPYRGSDLGSPSYIAGGLGGIFFDQMYGLFANAPVLIAAVPGLLWLGYRKGPWRLLAAEILFVVLPYLLTVTHFAMWWGGYSSPARFLVPLAPVLAVPAAVAWAATRERVTHAWLGGSLVVTACITAVLAFVDRGRLAYFDRGGVYASWLEWANSSADLAHGLPAYFARVQRQRPGSLFFEEIAIWMAALAAAWYVARLLERRGVIATSGPLFTAAGVAAAVAAMVAVTAVWRLESVDGRTPGVAAMSLLRDVGNWRHAAAFGVTPPAVLSRDALVQRLAVRLGPMGRPGAPPREDRALFLLPRVPAGEYRLRATRAPGAGWLMAGIGVGRDQFALLTEPIEAFDREVTFRLPVDVRAIVVRGDEDARARVGELLVRPMSVLEPDRKAASGLARRGVRYGRVSAFFMDERSFPEPGGFWLGGARTSTVVLQPESQRASLAILLRNAPIDNDVTLSSGGWREHVRLAPGEERRIDVPVDPARGAAAVTFEVSAGFSPAVSEPGNRDTRFLGVWARVE